MSKHAPTRLSSHTATAALAAAVAAVVSPLTQAVGPDRDVQAVEDLGRTAARDLVTLIAPHQQGSAVFTVPANKILVLTGTIDAADSGGQTQVVIDGSTTITFTMGVASGGSGAAKAHDCVTFPSGIPLQAGQTVQLQTGNGTDLLFGYLADA